MAIFTRHADSAAVAKLGKWSIIEEQRDSSCVATVSHATFIIGFPCVHLYTQAPTSSTYQNGALSRRSSGAPPTSGRVRTCRGLQRWLARSRGRGCNRMARAVRGGGSKAAASNQGGTPHGTSEQVVGSMRHKGRLGVLAVLWVATPSRLGGRWRGRRPRAVG